MDVGGAMLLVDDDGIFDLLLLVYFYFYDVQETVTNLIRTGLKTRDRHHYINLVVHDW
jgi:hypothetical protein